MLELTDPSHVDYSNLTMSVDRVKQVIECINDSKRAVELEAKMLEYMKLKEEKKGGKLRKQMSNLKPIGKVKIICNALP